jgi:ribosomal protein L40E
MRCSSCGAENPAGLKFCEQCATPFKRPCAKCGFENSPVARFCGRCAAPLEAAADVAPSGQRARSKPSPISGATVLRSPSKFPGPWLPLCAPVAGRISWARPLAQSRPAPHRICRRSDDRADFRRRTLDTSSRAERRNHRRSGCPRGFRDRTPDSSREFLCDSIRRVGRAHRAIHLLGFAQARHERRAILASGEASLGFAQPRQK